MFTILSNLHLFPGPLPGQYQDVAEDQDPPKAPWKRVLAQALEPWCACRVLSGGETRRAALSSQGPWSCEWELTAVGACEEHEPGERQELEGCSSVWTSVCELEPGASWAAAERTEQGFLPDKSDSRFPVWVTR